MQCRDFGISRSEDPQGRRRVYGAAEYLWEALEDSGWAGTALPSPPPPPCLLPSSLSNLSMSFQANGTHMSLNHSRSTCKGKGQEAQFDVAVRLFLLRRRVLALPTGRKWSLGILHAIEKQSRKERHTGLPDPEQGRGKGREGCLPALLPAYSLGWSVRRLPCPGSQGQLGTSSCRPGLEANLLRYCSRKREGRFTFTSTQEPQRRKGKMEVQSPLSWLLLPEAAKECR